MISGGTPKTKKEEGMKKIVVVMLALFLAIPAISYAGSATSRWDLTIGGVVKFDVGWTDQSGVFGNDMWTPGNPRLRHRHVSHRRDELREDLILPKKLSQPPPVIHIFQGLLLPLLRSDRT